MQPIASWKLAVPLGMIRAFIMSTSSVNTAVSDVRPPKNITSHFPQQLPWVGVVLVMPQSLPCAMD